jgi:hypothetical protein
MLSLDETQERGPDELRRNQFAVRLLVLQTRHWALALR